MDEMHQNDLPQSPEASRPTPFKIEYDSFIKSEKCPYKVEFAEDKVTQLLKVLGLEDKSIKKLKIKFTDKSIMSPDGRDAGAVYGNDTITISVGTWWRFLDRQLTSTEDLLDTQVIDKIPPDQISYARTNTKDSLRTEIQKKFDHDFIHETSHFAADTLARVNARQALIRLDFAGATRFLKHRASLFTPQGVAEEEKRAEDIVSKIEQDEKWKNIVVVKPTSPRIAM